MVSGTKKTTHTTKMAIHRPMEPPLLMSTQHSYGIIIKLCPMKTIVSALSIFGEKNGPSADVVSITWLTTRFTVTPTKHKLWSGFRNYPHKPK